MPDNFKKILDNLDSAIAIFSKDGNALYGNRTFNKLIKGNQDIFKEKIKKLNRNKKIIIDNTKVKINNTIVWFSYKMNLLEDGNVLFQGYDFRNRIFQSFVSESEQKLRTFFNSSVIGIWCFEFPFAEGEDINLPEDTLLELFFHGILVDCNETYARMLGVERESIIGISLSELMPKSEENIAYLRTFIRNHFSLSGGISHEISPIGEEKYFYNTLSGIVKNGKLVRAWGTQIDITDEMKLRDEFREAKEEWEAIFNSIESPIFITDDIGRFTWVNKVAEHLLGKKLEELVGHNIRETNFIKRFPENLEILKGIVRDKKSRSVEISFGDKGYLFLFSPLVSSEGKVTKIIFLGKDITERKKWEEKIRYMSHHDFLTELYNRTYFEEWYKEFSFADNYPVGIILSDLNNLKLINDAFGHETGDTILKAFSCILKNTLGEGKGMVARIGGDEFVVIIPKTNENKISRLANKLKYEAKRSELPEKGIQISVAVGYAVQNSPEENMDSVFRRADERMYKDKLSGGMSAYKNIIASLKLMLAERDSHTESHGERMGELAIKLGKEVGLKDYELHELEILAILHDIGKVGIPDAILFKPGPLSKEEWEAMKRHCEIGARISRGIPEIASISQDILYHHEWWDGSGYPEGLKGDAIPIKARIISIVDAYDSMRSKRPYKRVLTKKEAIEELKKFAGKQFDPFLIEKFLKIIQHKKAK